VTVLEILQSPVIAGLLSGFLVAFANHLFTKKKTVAEVEKLQAEAGLIRAQAEEITGKLKNLSDQVDYKLPEAARGNETILYTSDISDSFDFRLARIDSAEGELEVKEGILYIRRTNTAGRLQIWLESYRYVGRAPQKILPKNENISGDRKLRASCEIKAVGGDHTILFILKGENTPGGVYMGEKRQRITSNEWTPMESYFRVSPGQNCHFRIDDRSVFAAGSSSIQIRKLVLAERAA
jgi:hypothetical protein